MESRRSPRGRSLFLARLCLAGLALPAALTPQAPAPRPQDVPPVSSAEVRILARNQEKTKDRIFAAGDVEIRYREISLYADRVEFDIGTKDVLAEGNVVAQSGGQVIRGERVLFNLETGRGKVEKASGIVPPSILFEADSLERKGADSYGLKGGRVTACTQPNPRWSFSLSRGNLRSEDHLEMWDAVLRVKSVPVFYMPYLRYPLKERATGFLMPRIGFGGQNGFALSQSFYWAFAPNMDATVGVDFFSSRGVGAGLEFRYLFTGGTKGDLNLYYFAPKPDASGTGPGNSSIVRLNHTQALPLGFTLVANVDYQSSFSFLREFDNNFQRALVYNRTVQAYLSRSWRRFNLSARVSRFETYFSQLDDSNVSAALPLVTFNVFKVKVLSPLYFSLNASLNRWRYGWRSQFEAGTERRSTRLSVSPTLSVPFSSIPWLTANASLTGNLVYYGESLDPATGETVAEPLFTKNLSVGLEFTGPVLYRVFYGRDGRARLKNIIEPYVNFAYDSPISQADRVVTPYGYFRYHQASYGVTSRFLLRDDDRAVEVFSLGLGQTFYFSPEDGPLAGFPVDGEAPRFSEIAGTLRVYPLAAFSLDAAVSYNPYYENLSSLRLSATAGSKKGGDFLTLTWFTSRRSWAAGVDPELIALYTRDQIGVFGGLRLPGLPLDLQFEADYNIKEGELLYTGALVTYHYQCVDLMVDVRAFYYRVAPDIQVRFSLGLGAIGRTLDFLGGFGF
jgi:lipopolysaccharide assembly outer membrane protein LptD (OstA)